MLVTNPKEEEEKKAEAEGGWHVIHSGDGCDDGDGNDAECCAFFNVWYDFRGDKDKDKDDKDTEDYLPQLRHHFSLAGNPHHR